MCSNLKGFSENLITNPSSSYPGQLFNISVYYLYLHFEKKAKRSDYYHRYTVYLCLK